MTLLTPTIVVTATIAFGLLRSSTTSPPSSSLSMFTASVETIAIYCHQFLLPIAAVAVDSSVQPKGGKDRATVSGSSGAPPPHTFMYGNHCTVEDPRLIDVDRGAKLEVLDFMGDHDPEDLVDQVSKGTLRGYSFIGRYEDCNEPLFCATELQAASPLTGHSIDIGKQVYGRVHSIIPVRPPTDACTRSKWTFVDPVRSNLHDRFRHHAQDCPSPKLNMPIKSDTMIENEETKEAKETEETKLYHQVVEPLEPESDDVQDDVIGIIRSLLVTKGANREPQELQRGHIFYTRVKCNNQTKYTLTRASDPRTIRLKMTSLLIWRVPPSDGILGPLPNSTESSSFQWRRIDGATVYWLDQFNLKVQEPPKRTNCPKHEPCLALTTLFQSLRIPQAFLHNLSPIGSDFLAIYEVKQKLFREFELKDFGHLRSFLGVEVAYSPKGYLLSRCKYAHEILQHAHLTDDKVVDTPIEFHVKFSAFDVLPLDDPTLYHELVGSLISLS
ncbi:hypothetical protein Acr_29g0010690 [Actinidia rufa]|uniref:Reverse transcriptase Ty1/copia-type domain-containing protein n=1 Tax=Actinidia rufa TaxID=165716 RepID=A0A7J0HFK5_9ERIC|nr:hypothetical protein Acr_29g0010690 [Actinidia rufa]